MAEREFTTRFGADTSGFSKGVSEVVAQLDKYNKALVDNQYQIKAINKEITALEKQQKQLKEKMKDGGTEEQKKQYAELTEKIEQHRVALAQLRTDQTQIKNAISETSLKLKQEGEAAENASDGFTILKGAIANLVSEALNVAIEKFKEMSVSADKSLNSLQVKTGMSAEAVGELKDEMFDLYKNNYGDSLTDVADKIALVAQNIDESDPQRLKEITQNAIGLSDAFGSDFEENLRGVNGLMINMGLTAEEAFDLIAKGSQNGLDKTHELTDNLAEYSQIWGQAGFSAEEMFSILQNGLDSGAYTLDKVNDLVKEISISIVDGRLEKNIDSFSDKTSQIFKSFKDGKATQRDVFDSIIDDLNNTSNLAEKLAASSTNWSALGEDNAMKVIESLNNVNDTYKNIKGTMQEINDIQYDDIGSQIEAIGRQFEVDILQPVIEQASPKIKEFIDWVSNNLPAITASLAALVAGVATFKVASAGGDFIKTMVLSFKSLKPAIEAATVAQEANNGAVKANFYVALASAVLSAISAITTFIVTNNTATSSMKNVESTVKDYTQSILDAESAAEEKEKSTESEITLLQTLKNEYDELRKKTDLTVEEQIRLDNVAGEIAKTLGTTTDVLKDQNGAYKDLTGSIDEYISRLKMQIQIENSKEVMKSAQKVLDETQEEYDAVNSEFEKIKPYVKTTSGQWDGAKQLNEQEITTLPKGYSVEQLNILKNKWADLTVQRSAAQESLEKYEEKLKDALSQGKEYNSVLDDEEDKQSELSKTTEALSNTLSDMTAKTNAVTSAENEYNESKKLTVSTLQAVIDKYPELEDEVYKYMMGLEDAKTLINSMKSVYQNDLNAYISVIVQKASNSNTFYNQLINANSAFVNDAKAKYGIDLMNFKNLQEAKAAMAAQVAKSIQGPTQTNTGSFKTISGNDLFEKYKNGGVDSDSWQYRAAESIVDDFVSSSLSAVTNFHDFFKTGGSTLSGNSVSSAAAEAVKAEDTLLKRYELAEAAYNRLVDKRIEKIQKEQEAREKAKDAEIAAIDEEIEARKRLTENRDIQKELNEVNARLTYDRLDELSRRELERKRQDLLNEQAEMFWQRNMSDKKDSIENSYSNYKSNSDAAMAELQRAAQSAAEYFDELKNGYKSNTQIVNNNSDTRNIQIISNALSNQQMLDKLLKAIYDK